MSWQINKNENGIVLVLEGEIGIENAAEFHQAILPLAVTVGSLRVDAQAAKSVHSAIMQILYALSQAVPDFGVSDASEEFRAVEVRMGLCFSKSKAPGTPANSSGLR
jgi:anti-anti-sigma regulatory factor